MATVALIGFLGGLITGISPCILPVLPVVFLSGLNSGQGSSRDSSPAARPYLVIAGLVCSFGVVTLAGSALLSALHLPQDAIRWAALVTLTLIGLGLIFPPLQHLIERLTVLAPNERIDGEAVRDALASTEPRDHAVDTLADAESEQIRRVLAATGGNKSRAAQILGIERKTLYRKLERMKL